MTSTIVTDSRRTFRQRYLRLFVVHAPTTRRKVSIRLVPSSIPYSFSRLLQARLPQGIDRTEPLLLRPAREFRRELKRGSSEEVMLHRACAAIWSRFGDRLIMWTAPLDCLGAPHSSANDWRFVLQ